MNTSRLTSCAIAVLASILSLTMPSQAGKLEKLRVDFATYNPVSLVLKEQGFLEKEFAADGTTIEWVFSAGSNKAVEGLDQKTVDFGSTAGSASLLARASGSPIKVIYAYSRPEWTALVVPANSPLKSAADLKGKKIAATKGTEPYIFMLRALENSGLSEKDVTVVSVQHADGRKAMEAGEVDAWAGIDPLMAQAELQTNARLLFRDPYLNTYGVLNVREDFLAANPDVIARVIKAYEQAREYASQNPDALKAVLVKASKIDAAVAARQLERTDLRKLALGSAQQRTLKAAGEVLQRVGVLPASVNVEKTVGDMIDGTFTTKLSSAN
ncbi:MAG TPA: aliphatic sulfonate ABC transporter substrate-binding protein [Xanthobacteraceae bacterium]|jgi:sulfonate transport system substrate-binding protein|nr:aliphatic sulfonate ABC transporter substrate-binding protein [Xanthobacteraceae bacterium]